MKSDKVSRWLGYANRALSLVPDIPGTVVDTAAVGAAQGLIAVIQEALKTRTPAEVLAQIGEWASNPAATLDVDSIADKVKKDLADS